MKNRQRGAALVEFALVFTIFLTFFLGITDFARMLWTWNAANEATRWGARIAVVCDKGAARVLNRMQVFLPQLTASDVQIDWYNGAGAIDNTCDHTNCAGVSVSIKNLNFQWISPMKAIASSIPLPGFSTYLPREIMGRDANSSAVCS
jgi:Flp pilus assembly protein TadG